MTVHYSIVIPTLNERDNMAPLLTKIDSCGLADYEVIVVDEHSPDNTLEAVRAYAGGRTDIIGMFNEGPRGLSPSIVQGFSRAHGEIFCCMDGDLQHDVKDLKGLLEAADKADFMIGSRYVAGGGFAERWNPVRVLISRTATLMARVILGVKASDPMSGFFAIRRTAFEAVREEMSPRGFKVMLELLFLLTRRGGYRIGEYGITFGKRIHGKSKLSMRVIWEYLGMLIRLRRQLNGKRS